MAINTYRIPGKSHKKGGFFTAIEKFLRIDEGLRDVIHVRFLPQIIFVATLSVIYIGNRHYAEKKVRSIHQLERQVEDLRADYTTLQADYMFATKQSEVAKRAATIGLSVPETAPEKIVKTSE
jgi:cell division protein FtsL